MKTLKLRIKDKHITLLKSLARQVNFVWNYSNALCFQHLQKTGKFFSAYDLHHYTKGASKAGLDLHSQTIQAINEELCVRRKQCKKNKLRWRISKGARRSLGWIPFKASGIRYQNGQLKYGDYFLGLWDSYGLSKYCLKTGCFCEDARGRWYVCVVAELKEPIVNTKVESTKAIGVDLGLKEFATLSNGCKIEAHKAYRQYEQKLEFAQRAKKKQRVKAIHAKIANLRKEFHHQTSRKLVNNYAAIFIGNVSAQGLAQTKLAKSVLDAGWSAFRTILKYKCEYAGVWFEEVNEQYTTQTCSCCGSRQDSPKGRAGLRIREWTCQPCGTRHDRDVNAAKNILALGHGRLAEGILILDDVKEHRTALTNERDLL